MSQNILVVILNEIRSINDKVDALQTSVEDVRSNLPDVSELNDRLDAQSAQLTTIQSAVQEINDILNPELPEVPGLPSATQTSFAPSTFSSKKFKSFKQ
ncbi:P10 [Urbanus proteus nucleopolyhedrovirus]|uniref:P10 n=1 Tax=Urbanus proteus nucleopolyhedrovirus TaxID=1675866 RepID=A0A162GTR5_9ABAC|nr:P10 [Urbanus proteus nucleopolyhedrovirus]AKR17289.1 P10 [Urbanus proteus nucleopolyhedrovirus]